MSNLTTEFLSPERAPAEDLQRQVETFRGHHMVIEFTNAIPDILVVLNSERQIVFANKALLAALGVDEALFQYGLRPGEQLDCVHAFERFEGCGTTEFCRTCGAARAIQSSINGTPNSQECRIIQRSGNALDVRVWASPLELAGERFTIFSIKDISHEKRRRALEKIFFHDVLNTAGSIRGITELMLNASDSEMAEWKEVLHETADSLIDEIQAQRQLTAAENNELAVSPSAIQSVNFLTELIDQMRNHEAAAGKKIKLSPEAQSVSFISDRTILKRVLTNMLKNALEASSENDTVTLGVQDCGQEGLKFWVNNPRVMPREIQLQIFQRSFSTKGNGRGLGTYSMKFLSERYLQGKVTFTSSEGEGTTFFACYPLDISTQSASG
ncbi:MAG TPA: HAMP domain-containing sensor histidine kinase [Anaerolineaceae bacterium]|nr:HAMP domain-containing sensor histidine kinase [Anaerolineaceae bacterium]HPN50899.1 HAMP domain-containing sensor histidine kinase [Anaerolineaceae bacterium]